MSKKMYGELHVEKMSESRRKSRVCLIYTGGTIGMVESDSSVSGSPRLRPATLVELMKAVPKLGKKEGIELGMVSFTRPVDSSDVLAKHWIEIGKAIEEHYEEFDGFVVLHGTDTMAFTASGLSFILNNLDKPVVITGSQLPIAHPRTDALANLTSAIYIAGHEAVGLPLIPEVVLCFADLILRGNRATKVSSAQWQGFESPNFPPLGRIGEHIKIRKDLCMSPNRRKFFVDKTLAGDVKVIPVNPGTTPQQLERDLKTTGIDGVILQTYGTGNMQTSPEFIETIWEAAKGGEDYDRRIPILNVTQCLEGTVEMGLYEASSGLLEAGVISGLDLTHEAAYGKIVWAIAKFKDSENLRNQLQFNQRGEQSENLHELSWRPEESTQAGAGDHIFASGKNIPGGFVSEDLKSAHIRIQKLKVEILDKSKAHSVRIFINNPNADEESSINEVNAVCEFVEGELSELGNIVRDATKVAETVINANNPVSVKLVAVNAKIYCRSIILSLYTAAN